MNHINRRRFLRAAAAGGLAYAFGRTPQAVMAQTFETGGPFTDYKALVCVFLFGGNDSFNVVVPRSTAEYATYAASRQNLAIAQDQLIPINPLVPDGAAYGFHPSMGGLADLFERSRCAVVANVGPLLAPTTKTQYLDKSVPLPPQLFSHNDQQDQWQSLKGRSVLKSGWAGRIADVMTQRVTGQQLALNASLAGQVLLQAGNTTVPYIMGASGAVAFRGFGTSGSTLARRRAFESIAGANFDTVYERGFAEVHRRAVQFSDRVNQALTSAPPLVALPDNPVTALSPLATQLRTVAKLIAMRSQLGMSRQIFLVSTGGFDTHDDQLADQPGLLGNVSTSLRAFYDATVELGIANAVTTFTESDFGRTLTSNGDGTDHAWGGIQLVMGDAVRGRTLYGTYPRLEINGPDDVGAGRMIPTTSADQYAATLARWFGVSEQNLNYVAPSLANFANRDLGFLI
ncbi:MAG: DUF1501 domain-containing protein [Steroidobacteraceae bacterium]